MRLLPALVLVLSLVPLAAAQAPAAACGPIAATATSPTGAFSPGQRAEITVAVQNNGTRGVDTTVSISEPTAGWRIDNPDDQTQTIANGGTGTFSFTVLPTADATVDLQVTFQVAGACALPAPGLPGCPAGVCTTSAPAVGAAVRLATPSGGGLPGLGDLDFPLEYLVAGVVLVGVAVTIPFLLRRKPGGFVADCPEPLKMVRPGRGTSFPIDVRNASADPLTAQFEIGPVPEGWTAFMPLPEVQLAGKEARSLWLMVRSPATAREGEVADVEIRLRSEARPDLAATLRVRAEVNPAAAEGPTLA
jgi:hypothetical protein